MTEVLLMESVGCDLEESATIMSESIETLMLEIENLPDWDDHKEEVEVCVTTRQMQREAGNKPPSERSSVKKSKKGLKRKEPAASIDKIPDYNGKLPLQNIILFGTNHNLDRKTVTESRDFKIVEKSNNYFI